MQCKQKKYCFLFIVRLFIDFFSFCDLVRNEFSLLEFNSYPNRWDVYFYNHHKINELV